MRACPACGEEIDDDAVLCWNCGAAIEGAEGKIGRENRTSLPYDPHIDTTAAIVEAITDVIAFPKNARDHVGRVRTEENASVYGTLFLILSYQVAWLLIMYILIGSNPYIRLADYLFGNIGFVVYPCITTALFWVSALAQFGCYRLLGGKAKPVVHIYLTLLPSAWYFVLYFVGVLVAGMMRSELVLLCILIPGGLYLLYLHLLMLSYAHDMMDYKTIGAFILSVIVTIPIIGSALLALGILIRSGTGLNVIALIIASILIAVIVYSLRKRENLTHPVV